MQEATSHPLQFRTIVAAPRLKQRVAERRRPLVKIRTIGVGAPTLFVKLARRLLHHLLLHLRLFVIPSSKSDRLLLALLQLILAASTPLHLRLLLFGMGLVHLYGMVLKPTGSLDNSQLFEFLSLYALKQSTRCHSSSQQPAPPSPCWPRLTSFLSLRCAAIQTRIRAGLP